MRRKTKDPLVSLRIGFGGDGRIFGGFPLSRFFFNRKSVFLKEINALEFKDLLLFICFSSIVPR